MGDNDDWFGAGGEDDGPHVLKKMVKKKEPEPGENDWFGAGGENDGPHVLKKMVPEVKPAAAPDAAPAEGGAQEAAEEMDFLDPDKLLLCKHWIRPRFLQYKYLFDYRHNYYDDVIDFLDKRQRGLSREIPRAQTWAERALRTYSSKINRSEFYRALDEDRKLATKMKLTGAFYHYHTREYFNRKYASIL